MTRRVMIACPSSAGAPDYTTALSINRMVLEAAERGWITDVLYRTKDSCIERARDILFSAFYVSDCTDFLFIDDDVGCAPGSFPRLMDHPVDIVGGSYRARCEEELWVLKAPADEVLQFDPQQKTGLMEVEAVPTGFMRITRAAAVKLVEAHADDWYRDSTAPPGLDKIYHLFEFRFDREQRHLRSEDFELCRKWRALGGKVYVDPFLTLTHTGKQAFRGQLLDYLKRTNPGRGEPAPVAAAQPATTLLEMAKAFAA